MAFKKIYSVIIFIFLCQAPYLAFSQDSSDLELIKQQDFKDETFAKKRQVSFLFTKNRNVLVRYNPISLSLGGLMYVYQKFISVQIGANCPYEISCSAFSKQCIQKFGLIKGTALGADRLMRCTRLASADLEISDINEDTQRIIDSPETYQSSKKSTHSH